MLLLRTNWKPKKWQISSPNAYLDVFFTVSDWKSKIQKCYKNYWFPVFWTTSHTFEIKCVNCKRGSKNNYFKNQVKNTGKNIYFLRKGIWLYKYCRVVVQRNEQNLRDTTSHIRQELKIYLFCRYHANFYYKNAIFTRKIHISYWMIQTRIW